jgi:intracellular multiplication protein IcmL
MTNARDPGLAKSPTFYRDYYQALITALIASIFFILLMVVVVLYQLSHRPLPRFIAVADNGKKMELTAFNEPNYLPATLLRWASKATVAAYTFDFVNYEQQIANVAPYFTSSGWPGYKESVGRLIADITEKKLFVNGVVSGAPIIANQSATAGDGYEWRMQLPFLVTYQSAETTSRQNYTVLLTVVKIPTTVDPAGIGIDQFVMR